MKFYVIRINKDKYYGGFNYCENKIAGYPHNLNEAIIYPTLGMAKNELNHLFKLNNKLKTENKYKFIQIHIKFLDHVNLLNFCDWDAYDE